MVQTVHADTKGKKLLAQPAITRVSRAIRHETLQTYYSQVEFLFFDDSEISWSLGLRDLFAWVPRMVESPNWSLVQHHIFVVSTEPDIRPFIKLRLSSYKIRLVCVEGGSFELMGSKQRKFKLVVTGKDNELDSSTDPYSGSDTEDTDESPQCG